MNRRTYKVVTRGIGLAAILLAACCATMPVVAQEGSKDPTWAFDYNDAGFKPGAVLDLRSLNEKEAGESGFVQLTPDGPVP